MMTRTARDAVGYLARSGKKIDFICPYCGWVHSMDARSLVFQPRCRQSSNNFVTIIELRHAPIPIDDIIKAKNQEIAKRGGV